MFKVNNFISAWPVILYPVKHLNVIQEFCLYLFLIYILQIFFISYYLDFNQIKRRAIKICIFSYTLFKMDILIIKIIETKYANNLDFDYKSKWEGLCII